MKKRIIARIDIKRDKLIKGVHLEGLRVIGNPNEYVQNYYNEGIDEILLLDTIATLHGRNTLSKVIGEITKSIFIPITVGGGISSIEEAKKLFDSGADKISLNTAALEKPKLIEELSSIFGSQAIVLSLQIKKIRNEYCLMTHNGREKSEKNILNWIKEAEKLGVGEFLLTSIDKDGTMNGFDIELLTLMNSFIKVPIICSGGISNAEDALQCFNRGANAVAVGKAFHYEKINPKQLKLDLLNLCIDIRN